MADLFLYLSLSRTPAFAAKQFGKAVGVRWPAEVIALQAVTAQIAQDFHMLSGFDAFGADQYIL